MLTFVSLNHYQASDCGLVEFVCEFLLVKFVDKLKSHVIAVQKMLEDYKNL